MSYSTPPNYLTVPLLYEKTSFPVLSETTHARGIYHFPHSLFPWLVTRKTILLFASSSAMTSHDTFPFSSTSTSSSILFNHTPIQHLQTHSSPPHPIHRNSNPPSQSTHKKKLPPINSSNSHNSPPNLYTAVHTPVHNPSATPTLPSLHNVVHTTPRDPPSPLLHFDQI